MQNKKTSKNWRGGVKGIVDIGLKMWWLFGSAPDFWSRGPGFESGISHNDLDALHDHCDIM